MVRVNGPAETEPGVHGSCIWHLPVPFSVAVSVRNTKIWPVCFSISAVAPSAAITSRASGFVTSLAGIPGKFSQAFSASSEQRVVVRVPITRLLLARHLQLRAAGRDVDGEKPGGLADAVEVDPAAGDREMPR